MLNLLKLKMINLLKKATFFIYKPSIKIAKELLKDFPQNSEGWNVYRGFVNKALRRYVFLTNIKFLIFLLANCVGLFVGFSTVLTYCELRDQTQLIAENNELVLLNNKRRAEQYKKTELRESAKDLKEATDINLKNRAIKNMIELRIHEIEDIDFLGGHIIDANIELFISRSKFKYTSFDSMENISFFNSQLQEIRFRRWEWKRSSLANSNLSDMNLMGSTLAIYEVNIHDSELSNLNLTNAYVCGFVATSTTFKNVNFSKANLGACDSFLRNLLHNWEFGVSSEVKFLNTRFENVKFHEAILSGVEFHRVTGLSQENFKGACVSDTTKLPEGIKLSKKCG